MKPDEASPPPAGKAQGEPIRKSTFAGRQPNTPLTSDQQAEIVDALRQGWSYSRVFRATGVNRQSIYFIKRDAGLLRQQPAGLVRDPPKNGSNGHGRRPHDPPRVVGGVGKRMSDDESDHDRLLRMEFERNQDRKDRERTDAALTELLERTRRSALKTPTLDIHDGRIKATCPNCETVAEIAAPQGAAGPSDVGELLQQLDGATHAQAPGKNWESCPDCGPKVTKWAGDHGFVKKPADEED